MSSKFYKTNNMQLLKGDCIKILDKIEKDSIDMIFADPPYFLSSGGITCKSGKMANVDKGDWDKAVDLKEKYEFNKTWISKCKDILKDTGTIWISGTVHNIYVIGLVLEELGFKIINNITWQKTNPPPNISCRYFTHSTETILWAKKNIKTAKHTYNYELMKDINDNKQMKDVWSSPTTPKKEKIFGKHPTQKPEWLLERIILASTNKGDKVLDPFNGSGTTGAMCKKLGRNYIGIDINEEYLNISKERIENINIQEKIEADTIEEIQVKSSDNNQISFEEMYINNINKKIKQREEKTINMSTIKNKPFLKWAGGKTQLLSVLEENLPENIKISKTFDTYVEPFVGAGAFFIYLASNYNFSKIVINDINYKLINTYKVIKSNCSELINRLNEMKNEYLQYDEEQQKEMYLNIRAEFNNWESVDNIKQAANFIFINKTCFNGLYRENKKGGYNVPWGQHKNPSIFDEEQIKSISELLNLKDNDGNDKIIICNKSYRELREYIHQDTIVYFDPPYRPVTKGGFNDYNKSGFNDDAQIELCRFYEEMDARGAMVMLSNSDPKNLDVNDEFFDELYSGFNIQRVNASRMINSNGKGRGSITEILVKNY